MLLSFTVQVIRYLLSAGDIISQSLRSSVGTSALTVHMSRCVTCRILHVSLTQMLTLSRRSSGYAICTEGTLTFQYVSCMESSALKKVIPGIPDLFTECSRDWASPVRPLQPRRCPGINRNTTHLLISASNGRWTSNTYLLSAIQVICLTNSFNIL